jgi:tripartite-type tricarboxylate transporter receptor subunit TctC
MRDASFGLFVGGALAALVLTAAMPAGAAEAPSFKDKTLTMIVGDTPGGGTDAFARLAAAHLGLTLPGKPTFIVRNMPGAGGVVALNFFANQVKPDGLTVITGSGTQSDPLHYRAVNALYDLAKLEFLGGAERAGTILLISTEALPRLTDKAQAPVTMGALTAIRSGMQMTLWGTEYLGWNTRWVTGYAGNSELLLALERGEFDMTSLSDPDKARELIATGRFQALAQSGALVDGKLAPQPAFGSAPLLSELIGARITAPVARTAFEYWKNITLVGQWLALPPGTPQQAVAAYRSAFHATMLDPDFRRTAIKIDPGLVEMSPADVLDLMQRLAATPQEALDYMQTLQKKQGLHSGD